MKNGICVAGSIIVDNINIIQQYPNRGELSKILDLKNSVGGVPPNVGIDLKRIDSSLEVVALGKIGKDSNGNFVYNKMKSEGINVNSLKQVDTATSFTIVMSEIGGERTFVNYPGASSEFGYDDINFDELNCKMLHLGYFLLSKKLDERDGLKILKEAQSRGILTSIDIVTDSDVSKYVDIRKLLKYVDNLIINEVEASRITGIEFSDENAIKILTSLKEFGVKDRVIIHMPKAGYCLSKDSFTKVSSLRIPKEIIAGTPGAGDAFCAGSLYYIYKGKSDKEILEFASMSAALSLTKEDGVGAMRSEKEVIEFGSKFERL